MDDIIDRLDSLVKTDFKSKDKKKMQAIASLLIDLYTQSSNADKIAEYLCSFKETVIFEIFFEKAAVTLKDGQIEAIYTALRNNDKYKQNKNNFGTTRGFIVAAVLISKDNPYGKTVLLKTVMDCEKKEGITQAAIDSFRDKVCDEYKEQILNEYENKVWNNSSERDKICGCIKTLADGKTIAKRGQAEDIDPIKNEINSIYEKSQKANEELNKLLNTINQINTFNKNNETNMQNNAINGNNERLSGLQAKIKENEQTIADQKNDIKKRDASISQMQKKIEDLGNRLQRTLQLDVADHNQEIKTLKSNISNALKIEYQDYQSSKEKGFSQDQYEAYKASLFRIFMSLKQLNIKLE